MGKRHFYVIAWTVAWLLFLSPTTGQSEEILTVLHEPGTLQTYDTWMNWSGGPLMLIHHLNDLSIEYIELREAEIARLRTAEEWRKRQARVREYWSTMVGPWPERTPLNARVTGTLQKDGYRVEKIIFESLPGFHVTGALFIPENHRGRGPAILKVIGHSAQAFRREIYQNVILNLVHKGFVVLAIDPIGQGERLQYYNPETGKSNIGGSTSEHSHAGIQCFLSGKAIARYFVWDGIRAIDYLNSRMEVDPKRIGVTGLSGGGTQSSYIGAMDERVEAAAPMGFITSHRRLLESIGPQDAEQVFYHGLVSGIDHADLLEVRAPKPTLHVSTTRDFFSIQGARETEQEVRRAFEALGKSENYRRVEDDYEHGFTQKNNEATYAFFQQALDLPGDSTEQEWPYLTEEELTVTETGQVSTSLRSETVFSINRRESQPILESLEKSRQKIDTHIPAAVSEAVRLSGFLRPHGQAGPPVFRGRYQRSGYTLEKWGLQGEGRYIIPVLLFVPEGSGPHPGLLYTHPLSKAANASPGGEIERLVSRGFVVAAPDLLGFGETASYRTGGHGPVQPFYNAQLAGRSVVGINASDALRVLSFLGERPEVDENNIGAVSIGATGPAMLHAAAFEPDLAWVVLVEVLQSYESIVLNQYYEVNANCLVAGALAGYDLPDLLGSLAPRRVVLVNPVDAMGSRAARSTVRSAVAFPVVAYRHSEAVENLRIEVLDGIDVVEQIEWAAGRR